MSQEKAPRRGMKLFFLIYFLGLVLILTVIGVFGYLGYELINASMKYLLFGLLLGSALIGGGWWLIRRISIKWIKVVASLVGTVLAMFLIGTLIAFFQMILLVQTPLHFATLTSPAGEKVAIMRIFSADDDRIQARYDARGEEWDPEAATTSDLGYLYTAHTTLMGIFYSKDHVSEGEIEIGCASEAVLMYEWLDDGALHLFIENPEPGDVGEATLKGFALKNPT